jgi:Xaa-Pro aminopeptidase
MHPFLPQKTIGMLLKKAKADALLITNLINIRFLTGVSVSAGCVLLRKDACTLFVDHRYTEMAHQSVKNGITVQNLNDLKNTLCDISVVAFEGNDVTVARLTQWQKKYKNTKFVQSSDLIEELRREKGPEELQKIRKACIITKRILREMPSLLTIGISEQELEWAIQCKAREYGAMHMAFETIVAFGENTSKPHHHPTERRLQKGDLVQIDMGVAVDGYASDYSEVYFTDRPTPEQKKTLSALRKAAKAAKALVKEGVSNRLLDQTARKILKTYGYDKEFSHALGHGLGLEIHEGVVISSKAPLMKLKKNEVITIEPGLYFAGKWGMRVEETVVVS